MDVLGVTSEWSQLTDIDLSGRGLDGVGGLDGFLPMAERIKL